MEEGCDLTSKLKQMLDEIVGERASRLIGHQQTVIEKLADSLSLEFDQQTAYDIAFHLSDWNSDAAFIALIHIFPERFTKEEIKDGIEAFLLHVPNHTAAAAKLFGYPVQDIFEVRALDSDDEQGDSKTSA